MKATLRTAGIALLMVTAFGLQAQPGPASDASRAPCATASGGCGWNGARGPGVGPGYGGPGPGSSGYGRGYGRQGANGSGANALLTPEERAEHRAAMHSFRSLEECKAYMTKHQTLLAQRAGERGQPGPGDMTFMCDRMQARGWLR